jgi:hypothetical protein
MAGVRVHDPNTNQILVIEDVVALHGCDVVGHKSFQVGFLFLAYYGNGPESHLSGSRHWFCKKRSLDSYYPLANIVSLLRDSKRADHEFFDIGAAEATGGTQQRRRRAGVTRPVPIAFGRAPVESRPHKSDLEVRDTSLTQMPSRD